MNKGSILGIIAVIMSASGLGFSVFIVISPQAQGIEGPPGVDGIDGVDGINGTDGKSFFAPYTYYCVSQTDFVDAISSISTGFGVIIINESITLNDTVFFKNGGNYIVQGFGKTVIIYNGNGKIFDF